MHAHAHAHATCTCTCTCTYVACRIYHACAIRLQALGVVLGSAASLYHMDDRMLEDICHAYAAGEPLANRPMYHEDVQWREFTRDVDSIAVQPYLEQVTKWHVGGE